ncbi:MAG TPA: hypothetical protein VGL53_26100 [Bryobacteraceae bacterium]|jgi:hypothetical protein
MIARYLATLAVAVLVVTYTFSLLQFVTRSVVLAGSTVNENWTFEFTVDADSTHTYRVSPNSVALLQEHITFPTDGPVRIVSSKVEVTPKKVTWSENRRQITSTGAAMNAQVQWEAPSDSANGAHSTIYVSFPEVPAFEGKHPRIHSGGYQMDDQGRFVVREVTTYRGNFLLSVGRFVFALSAGLPIGIVLHSIGWIFILVQEKRARVAALPVRGSGLPQTFYPDPIAEWTMWLCLFGLSAFMSSLMAGFAVADGFLSSTFVHIIYSFLLAGVAIASIAVYFVGRSVLTVRVESTGISYARGRGELDWITAIWGEVSKIGERSRTTRGSTTYWMVVEFRDGRRRLKITTSIGGYKDLRKILLGMVKS